ncbi:MAG: hypothetical protein KF793_06910 [Nitrospira sp.]|nr:hypothetical protein [Nitrospira sp.]
MGADSNDLSQALVDVRKAFRLLFMYQQRIYDLAQTFAEECALRPYCVGYGFNRPSTGNPFGNWVWDMLPMYRASFLFLSPDTDNNKAKRGEWLLDIHLVSDSGYPEGHSWRKGQPNPESFPPSEDCLSYIGVYALRNDRDEVRDWYADVWRPTVTYPSSYPSGWNAMNNGKTGVTICGAQIDILKLSTKEAVLSAVGQFKEVLARELQIIVPERAL